MRDTEFRHNLTMKLIEIKSTHGHTWKVMPRWRGKNGAVHAPVVGGVCERRDDQWVITHLESGYHTGGYFNGSLREALIAARLWDESFGTVSEKTAKIWPLRRQWKRIISQGKAERPWRNLDKRVRLNGTSDVAWEKEKVTR